MDMQAIVKDKLTEVIDPELGINIIDLGLVYEIHIDDQNNVHVVMTLTTPGCPMHNSIQSGVENALSSIEGMGQIDVELVWDPLWSPDMMSEKAREQLWGPF